MLAHGRLRYTDMGSLQNLSLIVSALIVLPLQSTRNRQPRNTPRPTPATLSSRKKNVAIIIVKTKKLNVAMETVYSKKMMNCSAYK